MSVAVDKIEGVESVRVSLEEGLAEIVLEPDNTVDPELFSKIVRDNGFTPGVAELVVAGTLVRPEGRHLVEVDGPNLVYEIVEGEESVPAGSAPGGEVTVRGRVEAGPQPEAGAPRKIELLELNRPR